MTAEGMINAFRGDKRLLRWQKKGISKGEFFPPLHRGRRFPSSVSFPFYIFRFLSAYAVGCLLFGGYEGAYPPHCLDP